MTSTPRSARSPRPARRLAALGAAAVLGLTGTVLAGPATAASTGETRTPGGSGVQALAATRPGLSRLLTQGTVGHRGIVRTVGVPTASDVAALRALGLQVRPLTHLPFALVVGPDAALVAAVTSGVARDVYPDERLEYLDTASSDVVSSSPKAAAALRAKGFTGTGVTVGVVDSGCDATHPDLAERVVMNVQVYSPEYLNQGTDPILTAPIDQGPYDNTDIGGGHGTHVAGIIAADGTSGEEFQGVAPDAELACFSIGQGLFTTAVVSAYDYMLSDEDTFGIDVVNNSWGNSFRQYDPADPVNVATKRISQRGVVVVFAAGNSGESEAEASVSPFNQAPWVLSVAASDLSRQRGSFSSNGLEFDNGKDVALGPDGHTVLTGDRLGNTIPDLSAPGVDISSSCDALGTVIGPCPDHGQAEASGTSMASPHVAGAAAVLLQANPKLGWKGVQQALEATATPLRGEDGVLPAWQVGYGHVNLDKAVALVRRDDWKQALSERYARATRSLLARDGYAVTRADLWQQAADPAWLGGSYTTEHEVTVARGTDALKITLVYPTPGLAANLNSFTATLTDASGAEVAVTETDVLYTTGMAHVLVPDIAPGTYTVTVSGDYGTSDPDTIDSDSVQGRVVFLQVAQLRED